MASFPFEVTYFGRQKTTARFPSDVEILSPIRTFELLWRELSHAGMAG